MTIASAAVVGNGGLTVVVGEAGLQASNTAMGTSAIGTRCAVPVRTQSWSYASGCQMFKPKRQPQEECNEVTPPGWDWDTQ